MNHGVDNMDVIECISTLSSIRSFSGKQVPDDQIRIILEAARVAPSAHNDQPWQFILVRERQKLKDLGRYCLSGSFVTGASFAVVVLTDKSTKWYEIDGTRAVQNMVIAAWSLGIGSCWIGRIDTDGLTDYLGIPAKWHILTVLPFGYYEGDINRSGKFRKNFGQIFHLNDFGNKLEM